MKATRTRLAGAAAEIWRREARIHSPLLRRVNATSASAYRADLWTRRAVDWLARPRKPGGARRGSTRRGCDRRPWRGDAAGGQAPNRSMLRPSRLRRRRRNVAPRLRKSGLRIDRSGAVTRRVDPRIAPTYEGDAHPIGWRGRRNLEARGADPLAAVATAGRGAATRGWISAEPINAPPLQTSATASECRAAPS